MGEIGGSALLKLFGGAGLGGHRASVDERGIRRRRRVEVAVRVDTLRQRFYAISGERRIRHPAALAITERARREIFG